MSKKNYTSFLQRNHATCRRFFFVMQPHKKKITQPSSNGSERNQKNFSTKKSQNFSKSSFFFEEKKLTTSSLRNHASCPRKNYLFFKSGNFKKKTLQESQNAALRTSVVKCVQLLFLKYCGSIFYSSDSSERNQATFP